MTEINEISLAYDANHPRWKAHLAQLTTQITDLLEQDQLHFSIKTRVKSLESLSEKLTFLTAKGRAPEIKDLLGMRVVVPFQEGVEQVINCLRQHFAVDDIERKSDQLSYREFAYDSVHVELPLTEDLGLPAGCRQVVEVQVRTILQDAWAEVEHELIYKNHFRFPNNESIRKKLAALNANLTLSDMIFQEIRDSQKEMERWGKGRFKAMIDKVVEFQGPVLPGSPALVAEDGKVADINPEAKPGSKQELEKYMLAALKAHNEQDYRTAVHFYTRVLEYNPELKVRSVVFSHRGMAYFMQQKESQALSDFDRSFYCDKSNFRSLNYRAMVLRRMGYVEQALDCFAHSLEINASQAEVYFLRSQTLAEIDREEEAREDLLKALELEPDNEEARQLLATLEQRRRSESPPPQALLAQRH